MATGGKYVHHSDQVGNGNTTHNIQYVNKIDNDGPLEKILSLGECRFDPTYHITKQ